MPCAVTLSMSLGDFVEAFEKSRSALPARRPVSRGSSAARDRAAERAGRDPSRSASSPVQFPLELIEPRSIVLPAIPQDGRGRPAALTNARAEKVVAMACTGASIPVCAAAAGVTPNTLKSWLRRKDHEAFVLFQGCFADAITYATLTALRSVMEGVASNPKYAFALLARRDRVHWQAPLG